VNVMCFEHTFEPEQNLRIVNGLRIAKDFLKNQFDDGSMK
jgi:hypothetical protein